METVFIDSCYCKYFGVIKLELADVEDVRKRIKN